MTVPQGEQIRATVAVVGGFILGVLAVAVVSVPIAVLAFVDDGCVRAGIGYLAQPFALVGGLLALGTGYLCALGRRSPHAAVVFALFVVSFGAAVTIVVVATGGAFESVDVRTCLP